MVSQAPAGAPPPAGASSAPTAPVGPPVATIDGKPLSAAALDAHEAAVKLPRAEALADLIDLSQLRDGKAIEILDPALK